MYDGLTMEPTPHVLSDGDIELWRLRRNLELSPDERLEQLRRAVQWVARHRGLAAAAPRPHSEAAGT